MEWIVSKVASVLDVVESLSSPHCTDSESVRLDKINQLSRNTLELIRVYIAQVGEAGEAAIVWKVDYPVNKGVYPDYPADRYTVHGRNKRKGDKKG